MRHLLFICLLLFCVACEENESVDPTIMPEATTTGANTFGCLIFKREIHIRKRFSLLGIGNRKTDIRTETDLRRNRHAGTLFPLQIFRRRHPPPTACIHPAVNQATKCIRPGRSSFGHDRRIDRFVLFTGHTKQQQTDK